MSQKNKYGIFRYLTYWLYVFLALGVPVILIAEKYEIFRRVGAAKLTVWGILILLIALFFLRGQIKRVITGMDDGLVKGIILGIWGLIPMAVLYLALVICRKQIDSFLFIRTVCDNPDPGSADNPQRKDAQQAFRVDTAFLFFYPNRRFIFICLLNEEGRRTRMQTHLILHHNFFCVHFNQHTPIKV